MILIHGLYESRWAMIPLARRLSDGFACHNFCYASVRQNLDQHSKRLARFIANLAPTKNTVHFVAHSLGGLVVRHYLATHQLPTHLSLGNIVTLGTPHLGSQVAHSFHRLLPKALGASYTGGLDGTPISDHHISMGIIAGTRPFGIGLPLLYYHNKRQKTHHPHDGTVYVHETRLGNFPHLTLPISHTQLLTDSQAAKQTAHFLHYGCFCDPSSS